MYEVDVETFAKAHAEGAVVVDVREPSEHATGHLPGAKLIPGRELRRRLYEVPKGSPVYLLCATGARSLELISFMRAIGYDALSVSGGVCAWNGAGRSLVRPSGGV